MMDRVRVSRGHTPTLYRQTWCGIMISLAFTAAPGDFPDTLPYFNIVNLLSTHIACNVSLIVAGYHRFWKTRVQCHV
jgi:hypothetical protein